MSSDLREMLESVIHEAIQPLKDQLDRVEYRVGGLEDRFDTLENRFDVLETRFDALENRFDVLETRFDTLENRFDQFEIRFDEFENMVTVKFAEIDRKLDAISAQVAQNTESIAVLQKQMENAMAWKVPVERVESRVDNLALDIQVLKKAITA